MEDQTRDWIGLSILENDYEETSFLEELLSRGAGQTDKPEEKDQEEDPENEEENLEEMVLLDWDLEDRAEQEHEEEGPFPYQEASAPGNSARERKESPKEPQANVSFGMLPNFFMPKLPLARSALRPQLSYAPPQPILQPLNDQGQGPSSSSSPNQPSTPALRTPPPTRNAASRVPTPIGNPPSPRNIPPRPIPEPRVALPWPGSGSQEESPSTFNVSFSTSGGRAKRKGRDELAQEVTSLKSKLEEANKRIQVLTDENILAQENVRLLEQSDFLATLLFLKENARYEPKGWGRFQFLKGDHQEYDPASHLHADSFRFRGCDAVLCLVYLENC